LFFSTIFVISKLKIEKNLKYISSENSANFVSFLKKSPNFQYDKIEEKNWSKAFYGAHILHLLEEFPMLKA
jgi:hypothetical protein